MPSRNIYKDYSPDSYYHVYNRGINRKNIFVEEADYKMFLRLLKRYLGQEKSTNQIGIPYPSYSGRLELLSFCLMPSHFHLLFYQRDKDAMKQMIKSLSVAYAMYFNKKYHRIGPIFQQRYRASLISSDSYLLHISRYIHLNPTSYNSWEWSSLPYYLGKRQADWVTPQRVLELFENDNYQEFVDSYKDRRDELDYVKHELANDIV